MSLIERIQNTNKKSRTLRHRDVRRKLTSVLFDSLGMISDISVVGPDPLVTHFALNAGLEAGSLASCQILDGGNAVTVIGVPSRLWFSSKAFMTVARVKSAMEQCGRKCVLVPQKALSAFGRLGENRPIEQARVLIELIRDPDQMGIAQACCTSHGRDPVGCRAVQLLTGSDCLAS